MYSGRAFADFFIPRFIVPITVIEYDNDSRIVSNMFLEPIPFQYTFWNVRHNALKKCRKHKLNVKHRWRLEPSALHKRKDTNGVLRTYLFAQSWKPVFGREVKKIQNSSAFAADGTVESIPNGPVDGVVDRV